MTDIAISAFLALSGVAAFAFSKKGCLASFIGSVSCVIALLAAACEYLLPYIGFCGCGTFPAWYRLPIIFVGIAAALYAPKYLACHDEGRTGFFWLFFNLTLASMLTVAAVQNKYVFLVAWELMGLCSFFLVGFNLRSSQVMKASWIYLLGCEAGGMLLMLAFALTNQLSETSYFIALVLGFGLKAGFPLLHVWLPEAHPAAPAPVSALMSGAMIPLGFCGLFRFMPHNMAFMEICGWTLLVIGITGSISGILFALGQRDVKRLLAYSSVENIAIMAMGFGMGLLGTYYRIPGMGSAGFAGGALHLFNHALLKGTLFLGAGTILCSTGTLNMDMLGALRKKLPVTGGLFFVASLGICGLPPFCCFVSELLIYCAAFCGIIHAAGALFGFLVLAVAVLALTGGCACAAFAKVFSAVFQGEARSHLSEDAVPETKSFFLPLFILAVPSLVIPVLPLVVPSQLEFFSPVSLMILRGNAIFTLVIYSVITLFALCRTFFADDERRTCTWDCGYAKPTGRMEYTGTAFVQGLSDLFNTLIRQKKSVIKPEGLFPKEARIDVDVPDYGDRSVWSPLFNLFGMLAEKIHKFQSGYLHLYILMMVIALALMLLWGFFSGSGVK